MYLLNLRHNSVKSVLVKLGGIRAAFFFPAGTYGMLETCFRGETDAVTLLSVFGLPFLWLCAVVPCLRLLNRQYKLLRLSFKNVNQDYAHNPCKERYSKILFFSIDWSWDNSESLAATVTVNQSVKKSLLTPISRR